MTDLTESHLLTLSDDVFAHLFDYLSLSDMCHLEQCCSRLHQLAVLYWRRIRHLRLVTFIKCRATFDVGNGHRFDTAASGLIRRVGGSLRLLDLSDFGPLEYGIRAGLEEAILQHCTRLETLIIQKRLFERDWFLKLAAATGTTVRHLTLQALHLRGFGMLDDASLSEALSHWNRLESLDVRNNPSLSLGGAALPPTLTRLDCRNNRGVGSIGLSRLFTACPNLRSLHLTYHSLPALPFDRLHFLDELTIETGSATARLSPPFVQSLAGLCDRVSVLSVRSNLVCSRLLQLLDTSLTSLESLTIFGQAAPPASEQQVLHTLIRMPKLETLICTGCSSALALAVLQNLSYFVKIKHVDISSSLAFDQVNDELWATVGSVSLQCFVWLMYSHRHTQPQQQQHRLRHMQAQLRSSCARLQAVSIGQLRNNATAAGR